LSSADRLLSPVEADVCPFPGKTARIYFELLLVFQEAAIGGLGPFPFHLLVGNILFLTFRQLLVTPPLAQRRFVTANFGARFFSFLLAPRSSFPSRVLAPHAQENAFPVDVVFFLKKSFSFLRTQFYLHPGPVYLPCDFLQTLQLPARSFFKHPVVQPQHPLPLLSFSPFPRVLQESAPFNRLYLMRVF